MIYLNDKPINIARFPDGTSQVWQLPEDQLFRILAHVRWEFNAEGEFMHLAQLKDLLDHYHIPAHLEIKFLPYARQDKHISNETTFSLSTFARLLNSLKFKTVSICDPHSHIAMELIENSKEYYPKGKLTSACIATKAEMFCYPDKGALKKYEAEYAFFMKPHIYGEKVRDQLTGNITSYKLVGDPKGKNVMIVDDICDGGMTFRLLAKDLLAAGATEVNLFVTHGIFSKGLRVLKDAGIKRIFTQDGEACRYQDQIMYKEITT